ncbi:MAG: putative transport system permease protein [Blastocatellia bacterium]|jgi:putative ABC transport system permease protein|nr:putative transport system permease protein [Blastocatellia bacterium]
MKIKLPKILIRETLSMALDNVRSNKFRSFLTVLGIVIGVTAAIVVASILTGMRQSIVAVIEEYGTNNIYAFHLTTGPRTTSDRAERLRKPLTVADADAIKAQAGSVEDLAVCAPNVGYNGGPFDDNITYQGRNYRWGNTEGVTPNYEHIANVTIHEGRFLTESDEEQRRNVMVIGVNAADALFPGKQGSVAGTEVRMGGYNWEIVGVLEKRKAGFFGENEEDNAVLIPLRTAQKVAPGRGWLLFVIKARSGQLNEALTQSEDILRRRRSVKFEAPDDFDIKTADNFVKQFDSIFAMIGLVAIAISSLGLLVGGIGVMNIMLVSVTERTAEIGIRKALGARRRDITNQFLFEAMTLTFLGGMLGVVLAVGISKLVMFLFPSLPASIPMWAVTTGVSVSVGVGLIFGVWPARKAARLDPIECLRYE